LSCAAFVRDYIAAAIDRLRTHLERYIAEHLQYPEPFPFIFAEPVVSIRFSRRWRRP